MNDQYDADGQCDATCFKQLSGKRVKLWFCWLEPGHEGEHKSYRKRWPNENGSADCLVKEPVK